MEHTALDLLFDANWKGPTLLFPAISINAAERSWRLPFKAPT